MAEKKKRGAPLFPGRLPFRASRTAVAVIVATITLAAVLAFSTIQNINRARMLMERFLLQKGETLIMAVEAAVRTSALHQMSQGTGDPLHTLLAESSRARDVAFILIMDEQGAVMDQSLDAPQLQLSDEQRAYLLEADEPISQLAADSSLFIISKRFSLGPPAALLPGRTIPRAEDRQREIGIISVGLATGEYDAARRQDVQHALLMGATLFLVGSAGLYFLFLYQEMRLTQETLADMKIYTDNVIESIPAGLVTLDAADRVVSCNKKIEELFNRSPAELKGRQLAEAFPGCSFDWQRVGTATLEYPAECLSADGRKIPVTVSASSLTGNDGMVIGSVLIFRDMSLIRDMEQQLERSRRMAALGKMAAGIAHEIRNPLGTLRGFAHFFGSRSDASPESRSYAELMVSEVDRLNRNVSALLQFARPREPQYTEVRLDELLARTATMMARDFRDHGLRFDWSQATEIILAADPDLLLQVLMNLLKNSAQATPPGGVVSLRAAEETALIRITVSDSGSGMNRQEIDQMFDPFFTTKKTGTGLGLAVSHQIVEQHRGAFEVQSSPAQGTAITITLPKKQKETL